MLTSANSAATKKAFAATSKITAASRSTTKVTIQEKCYQAAAVSYQPSAISSQVAVEYLEKWEAIFAFINNELGRARKAAIDCGPETV